MSLCLPTRPRPHSTLPILTHRRYPNKGKEEGGTPGPKPLFNKKRQLDVANAAMALKRQGVEPTVAGVVARCPQSAVNPVTKEAFDGKLITQVFKTKCYPIGGHVIFLYMSRACQVS